MQVEEITSAEKDSLPVLLITGFGAHRVLAAERGLHILEITGADGGVNRATARVRLAIPPLEDLPKSRMHAAVVKTLQAAAGPSAVVRRYRREPSPLVRTADGSWRTGKYNAVLRGDFDLVAGVDVPAHPSPAQAGEG